MRESARQILDYMRPGFQQCCTFFLYLSFSLYFIHSFDVSIFWPFINFIVNDSESISETSSAYPYVFRSFEERMIVGCFDASEATHWNLSRVTVCHLIGISLSPISNRQLQFKDINNKWMITAQIEQNHLSISGCRRLFEKCATFEIYSKNYQICISSGNRLKLNSFIIGICHKIFFRHTNDLLWMNIQHSVEPSHELK